MPKLTAAETKRRVEFFLGVVTALYGRLSSRLPASVINAGVRKKRYGKATKVIGTQLLRNQYVKPNEEKTREGEGIINRVWNRAQTIRDDAVERGERKASQLVGNNLVQFMAQTLDDASVINPNILTDTFGSALFNITPTAEQPEAKQPEAKQPEAKEKEVKEKPKPKPAGQTMDDLMSSFPKMTDKEREEARQKVKEAKLRAMKKGRERARIRREATEKMREEFDEKTPQTISMDNDVKIDYDIFRRIGDISESLSNDDINLSATFEDSVMNLEEKVGDEPVESKSQLLEIVRGMPDIPQIRDILTPARIRRIFNAIPDYKFLEPFVNNLIDGKTGTAGQIVAGIVGLAVSGFTDDAMVISISTYLASAGVPYLQELFNKVVNAMKQKQPEITDEKEKEKEGEDGKHSVKKITTKLDVDPPPPDDEPEDPDDEPEDEGDEKKIKKKKQPRDYRQLIPIAGVLGAIISQYPNGARDILNAIPRSMFGAMTAGTIGRMGARIFLRRQGFTNTQLNTNEGERVLNIMGALPAGVASYVFNKIAPDAKTARENIVMFKDSMYGMKEKTKRAGQRLGPVLRSYWKQDPKPKTPQQQPPKREVPPLIVKDEPITEKPKEDISIKKMEQPRARKPKSMTYKEFEEGLGQILKAFYRDLRGPTISREQALQRIQERTGSLIRNIQDIEPATRQEYAEMMSNEVRQIMKQVEEEKQMGEQQRDTTQAPTASQETPTPTQGFMDKAFEGIKNLLTPDDTPEDIIERPIRKTSVLDETQAQLDQQEQKDKKKRPNMQWQPKTIVPSTSIFDESRHERFIDAVEYAQFNYVPEGSEGGYGTPMTNPLKRSDMLSEEIRYNKAGVTIPTDFYNRLLEASNLSEAELEKLFIGDKIPEMKFMAQDNDDTFDNVNTRFFVNNENTAVGMDDPYRFYSNVDNYWQTEPDSMLFTVNP
jgi:hypothetical protein